MSASMAADRNDAGDGLAGKNRRVLWILLALVAVLVIASFMVGIRW
jgi:flagellar basal body-associated protein FliL